jgi:hypothetical protein
MVVLLVDEMNGRIAGAQAAVTLPYDPAGETFHDLRERCSLIRWRDDPSPTTWSCCWK